MDKLVRINVCVTAAKLVKLGGLFSTLLLITACSTNNPYSYLRNPSLEKVLLEHADKVQNIAAEETETVEPEQSTQHLERMYKDWVKLKPKLERLVELEEEYQAFTKLSKLSQNTEVARVDESKKQIQKVSPQYKVRVNHFIQIGASGSEQGAMKFWSHQKRIHSDFLSNFQPKLRPIDKNGKTLYRITIGNFASRQEAKQVCDIYEKAGGQCMTRRAYEKVSY